MRPAQDRLLRTYSWIMVNGPNKVIANQGLARLTSQLKVTAQSVPVTTVKGNLYFPENCHSLPTGIIRYFGLFSWYQRRLSRHQG